MKLVALPEFDEDLEREATYIRSQRIRSAKRLRVEVREGIRLIRRNPHSFGRTEDGIDGLETREYLIERFGFRLIYAIEDETVIVLALIHGQLPPGHWHSRANSLTKRN